MHKNMSVNNTIRVIAILLILAAIIVNVLTIVSGSSTVYLKISAIFAVLALGCSCFYFLKGFSKDVARYYKLFVFIYLLSQLVMVISNGVGFGGVVQVLLSVVIILLLFLILMNKNLGKKASLLLCLLIIILSVADLVSWIVMMRGTPEGSVIFGRSATQLLLSCLMTLSTYAKYVDKGTRGTK